MRKKILLTSLFFTLLFSSLTNAQINSENFTKLIGSEPDVEINLGASILKMLSSATQDEEKGIASILSTLKSINVVVYELDKETKIKKLRTEISTLAKSKQKSGFEKLATIKEEDSLVYIFAKSNDDEFKRLTIFALDDDDELVLIDIQGSIKMSQIGELMEHFDVDLDVNNLKITHQKQKNKQ